MERSSANSIFKDVSGKAREINIQVESLEELTLTLSKFFRDSDLKKIFLNIHIISETVEGNLLIGILQNEINFFKFKCFAHKQFKFSLKKFPRRQIHFFFCCRGAFKIKGKDYSLDLPPLRLGVIKSKNSDVPELNFKAATNYEFTILNFLEQEKAQAQENFSEVYSELFSKIAAHSNFSAHLSNYNLKLNDLHKELDKAVHHHSVLRMFYLKAKCNELLVAYASQIEEDLYMPYKASLTQAQIDAVWKATRIIKHNFVANYTIPEIAQKVYICPSQLQYCFKVIFRQTVNEYILNARLELSRELLKDPEHYIADIVYKIGLNSKSYFSKIFKNKYRVSPSQYRRNYLNKLKHESI